MTTIDMREIETRVERVPAAPDQLYVLDVYNVRARAEAEFVRTWYAFAERQLSQSGCQTVVLHRDLESPSLYISYALWQNRQLLTSAIRSLGEEPAYPISGHVRQTFVRLVTQVNSRPLIIAQVGQVATFRVFSLKVNSESQFERLWSVSAQHEIKQTGCLYKRLHRDLNLPTRYVSYSLWVEAKASEEAASQHDHYQKNHTPYPLAGPVVRSKLEVIANLHL